MKRVIRKIPSEVLTGAQSKLDEVMNMLKPYLVVLSPSERGSLVKMGAESFRFVELAYGLAVEYPAMFPAFIEAAIFREGYSAAQELWSFENKLNQLRDTINDMEMAAGNHALDVALTFYQMVKIAARHDIPGARIIYEELKPRRPSGKRKQRASLAGSLRG